MSNQRGGSRGGGRNSWVDRIDWAIAASGAWQSLIVLVLTVLLGLAINRYNPIAGWIWLGLGVLIAFTVAAYRAGPAESSTLTGMAGALFGCALTVPMIYLTQGHHLDWRSIGLFAVAAAAIGGTVGYLAGKRHVPEPPPPGRRRRR